MTLVLLVLLDEARQVEPVVFHHLRLHQLLDGGFERVYDWRLSRTYFSQLFRSLLISILSLIADPNRALLNDYRCTTSNDSVPTGFEGLGCLLNRKQEEFSINLVITKRLASKIV